MKTLKLIAVMVLVLHSFVSCAQNEEDARPNIIFLLSDDQTSIVANIDMAPTILSYAGLEIPENMNGA